MERLHFSVGKFAGFVIVLCLCAGAAAGRKETPKELPAVKQDCSLCHVVRDAKPESRPGKAVTELCAGCHPDRSSPQEHRVDIVPSMTVTGLPLMDGKMTCVTCHDPHNNPYGSLLRKKSKDLCFVCHPM